MKDEKNKWNKEIERMLQSPFQTPEFMERINALEDRVRTQHYLIGALIFLDCIIGMIFICQYILIKL